MDSDDEWETLCEQTDPEANPLQACLFIEKAGDNFMKKLKAGLNASMLQVYLSTRKCDNLSFVLRTKSVWVLFGLGVGWNLRRCIKTT